MSTQHTLGPWAVMPMFSRFIVPASHTGRKVGGSVDLTRDRDEYAHPICTLPEKPRHITTQEIAANARLIAAAPELLDALRLVVDTFGPWHDDDCPCDDTCDCSAKPVHDAVNAAIKKAEGREP